MSDPQIRRMLLDELERHHDRLVVMRDSDLRDAASIEASKNAVNKAMGRLIRDGRVGRHRAPALGIGDQERPVMYYRR